MRKWSLKIATIPDRMAHLHVVEKVLRSHSIIATLDAETTKSKWLVMRRLEEVAEKESDNDKSKQSVGRAAGKGTRGNHGGRKLNSTPSALCDRFTFALRPAGFDSNTRAAYITLAGACPSQLSIWPYWTVQFFSHTPTTGVDPTRALPSIERVATAGCAALEERSRLRDKAGQRRHHDQDPLPSLDDTDKVEDARHTKGISNMMHFLILISSGRHSIWYIEDSLHDQCRRPHTHRAESEKTQSHSVLWSIPGRADQAGCYSTQIRNVLLPPTAADSGV